jgi:hypothetical protein
MKLVRTIPHFAGMPAYHGGMEEST